MKFKLFMDKLEKSKEYQQFKKEYPDNFLIAGFFVIDLEAGQNIHQLDFYIPSKKKVAAFNMDGKVNMQMLSLMGQKVPEKLDSNTNIDLDAIAGILGDEMHNRGISEEIKKIVAVLQSSEGKKIWNLNCVLTGMEILKSKIEDDSKSILKVEKSSLMDIMKRVPAQTMQTPKTKKEVKDEVKRLEALQSEISKERERLKKAMSLKKDTKENMKEDSE